jgi:3-hydroxyisobutyrate dehydrogenase-like beta-hydroxyacid dehydrogenase
MRSLFMGVGKMGLPMARHLQQGGHEVCVTDLEAARLQLARDAQLAVAADVSAELARVDRVFSSLPHDQALLTVADQVTRHARAGTLWVDTSTVSMAASAQAALRCQTRGIRYVRVTVSGNNHMAESAQLTVLASGSRADYDELLPALRCWGPSHFYLGEAEQARLMKLVINLMIAQTSAMLAEAMTLGRLGGLDWQTLWQVVGSSAVASPIMKAKSQQLGRPLGERDFSPTFTVHQMLKDIGLILQAGADLHVPLSQTSQTQQWMQAAIAQGDGDLDYAAIFKVVERAAGLSGDA